MVSFACKLHVRNTEGNLLSMNTLALAFALSTITLTMSIVSLPFTVISLIVWTMSLIIDVQRPVTRRSLERVLRVAA